MFHYVSLCFHVFPWIASNRFHESCPIDFRDRAPYRASLFFGSGLLNHQQMLSLGFFLLKTQLQRSHQQKDGQVHIMGLYEGSLYITLHVHNCSYILVSGFWCSIFCSYLFYLGMSEKWRINALPLSFSGRRHIPWGMGLIKTRDSKRSTC